MVYVHGAELRAPGQSRYGFSGIQQTLGIEGFFYFMEARYFFRWKLHTHLIDLFQANAVFTGDGAANFHT